MGTQPFSSDLSFDRVGRAVEKVRERLLRACRALDEASIQYAVAGGNAVAVWVAKIDESATRTTADVDILVQRGDFDRILSALGKVGFVHRHAVGIDMFLDGPAGKPREAVHLIFSNERVLAEHPTVAPSIGESEAAESFRVVTLEALVRMKLNAFRSKDRTHLFDLLDVGLIDASWPAKFPPSLSERLQMLIDNPE